MNGTMVVCLSCKKVVWACDSDLGDVRALFNLMKMPCRLCGMKGNYNGYRVCAEILPAFFGCIEPWSAMRMIADREGYEWAISPDCTWFTEDV